MRRVAAALIALTVPAVTLAQSGQAQAVKPPEKTPAPEDLQPEPSPVRVDSDAIKLPEKQFELPRHDPADDTPPPDEPPPPPARKGKKR